MAHAPSGTGLEYTMTERESQAGIRPGCICHNLSDQGLGYTVMVAWACVKWLDVMGQWLSAQRLYAIRSINWCSQDYIWVGPGVLRRAGGSQQYSKGQPGVGAWHSEVRGNEADELARKRTVLNLVEPEHAQWDFRLWHLDALGLWRTLHVDSLHLMCHCDKP